MNINHKKKKINFLKLAKYAAQIADDKKAVDISILNVRKLTVLANYFVIFTVESSPQMNAIINTVHKTFRDKENCMPIHLEGRYSEHWSVLDYGGLVIHAMMPEARKFYALDRIWDQARKVSRHVKTKKHIRKGQ